MNSQSFVLVDGTWEETFAECDFCGGNRIRPYMIKTSDDVEHVICIDCIWKAVTHSLSESARNKDA